MKSSGISSKTTTRAADNAGVKVPNKNLIGNNFKDISGQSMNAGLISGAFGGVISVMRNAEDLRYRAISPSEFGKEVAKDIVKTSSVSAAKTAVALGMKEGGEVIAKKVGSESLKKNCRVKCWYSGSVRCCGARN